MPRIEGLAWDEESEDHIARHGISSEEVEQAVENREYERMHRGYLLILGRTDGGRYITVILDHERDDLWYPVTARPMTQSERRLLRRHSSRKGRR